MEFNVENYLTNLSYINKDFPTLWNEILETVPKLTNKWVPNEANESDPLVVLLKELAIIADKLNYNIDKNVLELFPATLTQERSAYNVYQSLGYVPDWYVSATTDLTVIYSGIINTATPDVFSGKINVGETTVTLPKFTPITNEDQTVNYVTLENVNIYVGLVSKYIVPVMEGTINDFTINGATQITVENLDSQNRLFFTETNIAQNGIFISNYSDFRDFNHYLLSNEVVADTTNLWVRVDNLNQYEAGSRVYRLGIDAVTNSVYVQFPDDIGTLIEDGIYIKYILSSGEEGNVGTNELNQFLNEIELPIMTVDSSGKKVQVQSATTSDGNSVECKLVVNNFTLTNTASAQNGANPLDIEQMHEEYNKIVGVFDTLVAVRDYENFIYQSTYLDGSHVVSNIRVSDRSNDLYGTLSHIILGNDGSVSTITESISDEMTAYTLRLFPLENVEAIDTKEDFDRTFNIPFDSARIASLNNEVQSVVADSKCVSHDFARPGSPILINYDLEGQIYLKSSVSGTEATLIAQKVESKLLQSLNSRELEWGRMVDYGTVVDIIKSADDRIQYVGLNPIVYEDPQEVNNVENLGFDATIRTILAGDKAWTDFSPYAYTYSNKNIENKYFGSANPDSDKNTPITGIVTDVSISNPTTATSYIVNNNETFTILLPQYNSVTEYGNYLYMIAKSSSTDSSKIVADVPTQLTENQTIYIYQTRTAAEEAISSDTDRALRDNADYIIEPGTIIKSTADIEFSTSLTSRSLINMGGSIKVTTMERATGTIKPSNNITTGSDLYILYLATNSEGLREAFKEVGGSYTLVEGEYLFYTDAIGAELGVIGEGTTLTLIGNGHIGTDDDPDSGIYLIEAESDVANLVNGNKDNSYLTTWTQVSSNKLNSETSSKSVVYGIEIGYSLNELFTFGSNYLIEFLADVPTVSEVETLTVNENSKVAAFSSSVVTDNDVFPKTFMPLTGKVVGDGSGSDDVNVASVRYQLLDVSANKVTVNDKAWEYLDKLMADDSYKYLVKMSFVAGPGVEQEITDIASQKISSVATTYNAAQTSQSVTLFANSATSSANAVIRSGNSAQATSLLLYGGGMEETYSADSNIGVMYRQGNSSTTSFSNGFVQISSIAPNKTDKVYFPGSAKQVAVFPYIVAMTGAIGYGAISGGTSVNSNGTAISVDVGAGTDAKISIVALGIPRVADKSANVYSLIDGVSINTNIGNMMDSASGIKILGTDYLYRDGFYPLYTVDADYAINNPTKAESYFMSNHPYNRYVMPHLNNYNKLIISPMSILN